MNTKGFETIISTNNHTINTIMQDLPFYIFVSFVACLAPGSGVLYTISWGFRGGMQTALASPIGTTLGVAIMCAISATGLGALIASSPFFYGILQFVSAAVLVWLGWQSWSADAVDLSAASQGGSEEKYSFKSVFWGAVVLQATNIMLIVFLLSLMPQFITPADNYPVRITILSVLFCLACFIVHFGYSYLAAVGSQWLSGERFSWWLNRISAVLFWLLAASVVWGAIQTL